MPLRKKPWRRKEPNDSESEQTTRQETAEITRKDAREIGVAREIGTVIVTVIATGSTGFFIL